MAYSLNDPAIDPILIGYTKYSQLRVGNLIAINGSYKGTGIIIPGQILALEHEDYPSLIEVKNLSNGSTAFVKPSAPGGPFGALILYPENLGFRRDPENRHLFSDGITILSGHGFQNFKVTDAASGKVLYEEQEIYDILSERSRILGIEHVHELQNLYTDNFPYRIFDLSGYILKRVNEVARFKEEIDTRISTQ
ncbi:hypothetical protein [Dyadobacter sp. CY343]|uniref:hypothetical protein n=1 Tax=Dyadobacter sp. CY343 TaxID=2907299 RepID=UPI001F3F297E|nr:hypothetical protein [Dyadobacter sp. CY343]MCE7061240.1 hypothetical protein [Dyadobacter sp. CY343]